MIPKRLRPGDTIGLISPAGVARRDAVDEACRGLQAQGFETVLAPNLFQSTWGYAASAEERAADFNTMLHDERIKMILFGGGEVCNEILPYLNFDEVTEHPKIICSYSDSTTLLNAIYAKSGLVTYYGASPGTFRNLSAYNRKQFFNRLADGSAGRFQTHGEWITLCGGKCRGLLIGGYLVNFALLINGKFLSGDRSQQYILFLEDHLRFNEPAAVARYLSHIQQSEFFRQVSGLVFGHYAEEENKEIAQILKRFSKYYNLPAVWCDDFGHGVDNAILPIGIKASLDADRCELFLEERSVL